VDAKILERHHLGLAAQARDGVDGPARLAVGAGDFRRIAAGASDAYGDHRLREQVPHPGQAACAQAAGLCGGRKLAAVPGDHDHHLVLPDGGDRPWHPGGEEVVDGGGRSRPHGRCRAARPRGPGGSEGRDQDPVLAGGVIAEVPGPPPHLAVVAPAAKQQSLDEIIPHLPGRRRDDSLPAKYHPADRGGVLGDEQAQVSAVALLCAAEGHQVGRDVVADKDRRHDDGHGVADVRQPE